MVKLAQHRLDYVNYRAENLVETGAFDLAELGASSYAAGIRMLLFHAIVACWLLASPSCDPIYSASLSIAG